MEVGTTKVFIQSRAYEVLEQMRSKKLMESALCLQSNTRMFLCRINYEVTLYAVRVIQRYTRGHIAQRYTRMLMIERSANVIQRGLRCAKARYYFRAARCIACWAQSAFRGAIARQYCAYLFLDLKASSIQQAWKRYKSTYTLRKVRSAIICIQTRHRCRVAVRDLRQLRIEARDLFVVAAERDKYRDESNRLKRELEQVQASPEKILSHSKPPPSPGRGSEMERLRFELQDLQLELEKFHRMSSPSKSVDERAERLEEELARREDELALLRQEVAALRSKDDLSSTMKSMTIDTTNRDSSGGGGWNSCNNLTFVPSPRQRASPVRSDISLLDDDIEDELPTESQSALCRSENHNEANDNDELCHLHTAIRQKSRRHLDQVLQQTSEVCVLINQGDKYGRTAMHLAAIGLDIEIAEVLVSRGAVVNAQDDDGETPLHLAENAKMTEFLIRKGKANPNIPNVDGICALHLAVQRRDVDSVRILVMNRANVNNADNIRWFTPLHLVALPARLGIDEQQLENDVRCRIAQLLTGGDYTVPPDLNYQDSEGNTPLHYAVQLETDDAYNLVNLLLERNANPNVQNLRGQVPFHLLCHNETLRSSRSNYTEMIHNLLLHGANPSIQSQTGCTALHLALYHQDIDTAVILVNGGAELHAVWKKVTFFWNRLVLMLLRSMVRFCILNHSNFACHLFLDHIFLH
jgi:ankyrin repeat protein